MVMRHSAWHKNNFREVRHTWERYLAILAIIALGVGFFTGLVITKPAMVQTLDSYVAEYKMHDYQLLSTLGLTKEDVRYFDGFDGAAAEGAITLDFIADTGEGEDVVLKAHTVTYSTDKLNLISGRLPESGGECVLDSKGFAEDAIGSKICLSSSNDEDTRDAFAYDEYTVVGLVDSPNYLTYNRGTSSIGSGIVYAFAYLTEEGFSTDYYTEILLGWQHDYAIHTDEYDAFITAKEQPLKDALKMRSELRYEEIIGDANEELADAQQKFDDANAEYLSEKADAEAELADALTELENAAQEISEQEQKLVDANAQLADAQREYRKGVRDYEQALSEYETKKEETFSQLAQSQAQLDENRAAVTSGMAQIEESGALESYTQLAEAIAALQESLALLPLGSVEYMSAQEQLAQSKTAAAQIEASGVIAQYEELQNSLAQLDAGQAELDAGRAQAEGQFAGVKEQLDEAKARLDSGKKEIDRNKRTVEDGWEALEEGKEEYAEGLAEYEDGRKEADESFAKAEEELADAQSEIDDARGEVADIAHPDVYALDRSYNSGYASFENDSSIVEGIARVLPLFFFLVAALVCSTTMTRMVDEQRTQIGTLKALGFGNGAIALKYTTYSGSAAIIGWVIGLLLGTKYFPMAIWEAYGMLYKFAPIEYFFDWKLAAVSLAVALLCSAGITYTSCKAELQRMPAHLIRPKAPKPGKRVLLERIPSLWNRLSFLRKVAIRNILLYKKRFFMTVLGVAGCTALMLAALGIRDSVQNIANDQFDSIMTFDYNIAFSDAQSVEDREKFAARYTDELKECVFVCSDDAGVTKGEVTKKVSAIATDDRAIENVINLQLQGEAVDYPKFGEVAVSSKLTKTLGLAVGDSVSINFSPKKTVDVKVGGVFENYVGDYIYMTAETYSAFFGEEPQYKTAYATTEKEDVYAVSALLANGEDVASVSVTDDVRTLVSNMMQSLDYIILLVIACAAALGFVVIYNLNNINITERSREIATLKVLGFFKKECETYIFRETLTLTAIGAVLGLALGTLLHTFVMNEINVDMVTFKEQIFPLSYIIAFVATFAIAILVNLMLKRKIEDINMAESLSSME